MNDGVEGLRIGIPRAFFFEDVDPQIRTLVLATAKVWERAGAEIVDISIPEAERTQQMLLRMVLANRALLYGNILDTTPELLSPSTRKRLAVGRSVSGVEYAEAEDFRGRWNHILQGVFESVDLFLSPTVAVATPARESSSHVTARGDLTRLTCAQSLAGIPSMSLPCGFRTDGMPVGAQLSAGWWNDDLLVRAGVVYQAQTNWHLRLPPGVDEPVFL